MDVGGLPVGVLQDIAVAAVQHPRLAVTQRGRVPARDRSAAAGFDADELDVAVRNERVENSRGIAATTHAGDHDIG